MLLLVLPSRLRRSSLLSLSLPLGLPCPLILRLVYTVWNESLCTTLPQSNFSPKSSISSATPRHPHVAYSSPSTSPVSSGLSRRPLPSPGVPQSQLNSYAFRPPLPTPGPTPAPTSPQPHSRASHASSRPAALASNVASSTSDAISGDLT
jgi:hypothetical protein